MKFNRIVSIAAALFCLCNIICAQTAGSQADKPKTDLEVFQEKYGSVIVQGYTNVATMNGLGGSFTVIAKQFVNPATGTKVRGLVVEVDSSERYASSARSFIEYGEIDSLIKGIDYISKLDKSVTKLQLFEAEYKTKGKFSVTVFNNAAGKLQVAIAVGRIGRKSIYTDIANLPQLTTNLQQAKGILDTL